MLKFCLYFFARKKWCWFQHHFSLLSAEPLTGFFYGLALAGEEFLDKEVRNLPESVDSTGFNLLVAGNHGVFDLFVAAYNAFFNCLISFFYIDFG